MKYFGKLCVTLVQQHKFVSKGCYIVEREREREREREGEREREREGERERERETQKCSSVFCVDVLPFFFFCSGD